MTKKELARSIADALGIPVGTVQEVVQRTFDGIIETLLTEGRIELRNFGVFQVHERKARRARNPRTGATVAVPARRVVTFKPGKEMEEKVKRLTEVRHMATVGAPA